MRHSISKPISKFSAILKLPSKPILLWLMMAVSILGALFVSNSPPLSAQQPQQPDTNEDAGIVEEFPPPLCPDPNIAGTVELVRICVPVEADAICTDASANADKIGVRQLENGSYQYVCFSVGAPQSPPSCSTLSGTRLTLEFTLYEWDRVQNALGPIDKAETNADCDDSLIPTEDTNGLPIAFDCETSYTEGDTEGYEELQWPSIENGNHPRTYCRAVPIDPTQGCSDGSFLPVEHTSTTEMEKEIKCYSERTQAPGKGCPISYLKLTELESSIDSTKLVRSDSRNHFGLSDSDPATICFLHTLRPLKCMNPGNLASNEEVYLSNSNTCHIVFNRGFNPDTGQAMQCPNGYLVVDENSCIKDSPLGSEPDDCQGSLTTEEILGAVDESAAPFSSESVGSSLPLGWAHFEHPYPLAIIILNDLGVAHPEGTNARWVADFSGTDNLPQGALVCARAFETYSSDELPATAIAPACGGLSPGPVTGVRISVWQETDGDRPVVLVAKDKQGQVPVRELCVNLIQRPESGCPVLTGERQQFEVDTDGVPSEQTTVRVDSCFELQERTYVCGGGFTLVEPPDNTEPTCENDQDSSSLPARVGVCPQDYSYSVALQSSNIYAVVESFSDVEVANQRCGKWKSYIPCTQSAPLSVDTSNCGSTDLTEANLNDCIDGGNTNTDGTGNRVWVSADFDSSQETTGSSDICLWLPSAECPSSPNPAVVIYKAFHSRCYRQAQPGCSELQLDLVTVPADGSVAAELVCAAEVQVILICDMSSPYPVLDIVSQKCLPDTGVSVSCAAGRVYRPATGLCERVVTSYPVDAECTGEFNVELSREFCGKRNEDVETYRCSTLGRLYVQRADQSGVDCYIPAQYGTCASSGGVARILHIDGQNTEAIGTTGTTVKAPNVVYCAEVTSDLQCDDSSMTILNLRYDPVSSSIECASGSAGSETTSNVSSGSCTGDVEISINSAPQYILDTLGISSLSDYSSSGIFCLSFAAADAISLNAAPACQEQGSLTVVLADTDGQDITSSSPLPANGFADTCYGVHLNDDCKTAGASTPDDCEDAIRYSSTDCAESFYDSIVVGDVLDMRVFYNSGEANFCTRHLSELKQAPAECTGSSSYIFLTKDSIEESPVFDSSSDEYESYLPVKEALTDGGICGLLEGPADLTCEDDGTSAEYHLYIFRNDPTRVTGCYERQPPDVTCQTDFVYNPSLGECVFEGDDTVTPEPDEDTTPVLVNLQCLDSSSSTEQTNSLESLLSLRKITSFSSSLNRYLVNHPVEVRISLPVFSCESSVSYAAKQVNIRIRELRPLTSDDAADIVGATSKEDVDGLGLWDDLINNAANSEEKECLSRAIYGETVDTNVDSCEQLEATSAAWNQRIEDSSSCEISPAEVCITHSDSEVACPGSTFAVTRRNELDYDPVAQTAIRNYCFPRPTWYAISVIFIWESTDTDSPLTLTHQVDTVISVGELISVARLQE